MIEEEEGKADQQWDLPDTVDLNKELQRLRENFIGKKTNFFF